MDNNEQDFMTEALQIAAQCWGDPETERVEMDARLAKAFAMRLAGWMEQAAHFANGMELYRNLLDQTAAHLGKDVYVSDDGSIQDEPIRLKIPEMVAALAAKQ